MINQRNRSDLLIPVTPQEQQELVGIKVDFNAFLQANGKRHEIPKCLFSAKIA